MRFKFIFGTAALLLSALVGPFVPVAYPSAITDRSVSSFVDTPPNIPFYNEIMWLAQRGISTGWADGTFRPYQPVTRDAMAAFMYRLADVEGYTPPAKSPFVDVPTSYQFYTEIAWLAESGISTGWDRALTPDRGHGVISVMPLP